MLMDRYTLFLPAELREGLKALKERDGISESEAIRRAVREFLAKRKIHIRQATKGGTTKRSK